MAHTRTTRTLKLWSLCAVSLGLALGCGSDPEEKAEPEALGEGLSLDCTGVEGRPEGLKGEEELYDPGVIKGMLEKYEALREAYGDDQVTNCDEARKFLEAYREVEQEILEQNAEENPDPETTDEDVTDLSDAEPFEEVPEELDAVEEDDSTPTEDVEIPAGEESASTEIEKINNGFQSVSQSPPIYKICNNSWCCSSTAINNRWLMTAAHCVTTAATQNFSVYQQDSYADYPTLLFSGGVDFNVRRLNYGGTWNYGNDIALMKVVSSSSNIRFTDWARIWLGDRTATNCGACATSYNSLWYGYGYGSTNAWDDLLGMLHWGRLKVTGNWWNYFDTSPYDANNHDICSGDSGGPTGAYMGAYFTIAGVNSASWCGAGGLYGGSHARPKYHWVWIRDTVGCHLVTAGGGYQLECF